MGTNQRKPSCDAVEGRILVVDDENGPRQALRMLLNERYEVFLAQDVPTALKLMDREPIDLVITDIRMPKQTGVDLLREVKSRRPDVQVLILTGYGQLETAMDAVKYGAFAYMEKPFDNNTMLERIQAGLQLRQRELERRQLERLALEANRFDTLGRVISGMIHDLGTPLSVIGSSVEMLMAEERREDTKNRLEIVQTQVHHCGEIVRKAMNFLRHQPDQVTCFGLNEVVEACLELTGPWLRQQSVTVKTSLAHDVQVCTGDFMLVRQAVLNLIGNACQAMENAQTDHREITLKTWSGGGYSCLSVADTGPGIPPAERNKIFETFYSSKAEKGTGLGLAVVKNVMQRHGGEVLVDDNASHGALFTLRFPNRPQS